MPFFDATLAVDALIDHFRDFMKWCKDKHDNWPQVGKAVISIDEDMQDLHDFLSCEKFKKRMDAGNWNDFLKLYGEISDAHKAAVGPHEPSLLSKVQSKFTKADADSVETHRRLKAVMGRISKLVELILRGASLVNETARGDHINSLVEEP